MPPQEGLQLSLLDAFELRCDGQPVPLPMTAQRLLALLALHDHPVLRVRVAGLLWLDAPEERAAASLRSTLWRLHSRGSNLVVATNGHLSLGRGVRVDVRELTKIAHRLFENSLDCERIDLSCTPLIGELLPDWYDDWVIMERERLRQISLQALEALAEQLIAAGRLGAALEAAHAALTAEPLRESAHRTLINVHLADGNIGEALHQFRFCCQLLHNRLRVAPSPQLAELMRTVTAERRSGDAIARLSPPWQQTPQNAPAY